MGDGSEAFDFVSVIDCARANIKAMKSESSNEFYNVGTGKELLSKLAELILKITGSNLKSTMLQAVNQLLLKTERLS